MKKIITGEMLSDGQKIPKGFGLSYYLIDRDAMICHPVPFNLLVRFFRKLWESLACKYKPTLFHKAYLLGRKHQRNLFQNRGIYNFSFSDGIYVFIQICGICLE